MAHDGLGESSQKLLDDSGCPVDELIFPKMKVYNHKSNMKSAEKYLNENKTQDMFKNIMSYKHASTIFSAFKFPDRARLHLTCGLELCKGECLEIDCKLNHISPKPKDSLLRKVRLDREAVGLIIDRLQVYNSIEVLAPNIELENDVSVGGLLLFY